ncbi:angiomotin-like [Palaemon carinicauda]|uniref:angiomotin-like n=1 Tax=Palaemon carinicauda TaxID=392227 RepID=UPI0035B66CCB
METWSFLIQHIVRGETVPSEEFGGPESAAVTVSDEEDGEVRSTGSQSQASTSSGKGKGKEKLSRPRTTQTATTTANTWMTQSDLSNVVQQAAASALPAATSTTTHDLARPTAAATLAAPSAAAVLVSTSTSHLVGTTRAAAAADSAATSSKLAINCNMDAAPVTTVFRPVLLAFYHGVATRDSTCAVSHPCPGSFTKTLVLSLSATFKTPVTTFSFPVLTPGSIDSNLEECISPSSLYTSKELSKGTD